MESPRYSFVIPAFNEQDYLPRLLDSLEIACSCYRRGPQAIETIVSDNGSSDRTAEIALKRGCRLARVEKRSIAAVRNGGAALARGRILAFCDADSRIHPDTFNAIDEAMASGRFVAGATGLWPERMSAGIAATVLAAIPVALLSGMDVGVVFCRRLDFEAIGGYDESRLFAEDVQFLADMKRLGRGRRQGLARLNRVRGICSMRKFDTRGDWHFLAEGLRSLGWLLFSPRRLDAWARDYWYDVRST